ncbi:MAG TPA: response regulator [Thermoanaerobaculia bacterium]|nr:response regulator [Thermoanaerobaculia bacterium]
MRKLILVVEDDNDLRETLLDVLDRAGFEVVIAANGEEALATLESGRPTALVLLDLHMPVMDGLEFRRRQLESIGLSDVPVLVITGDRQGQSEARRLGFERFLSKPFGEEDLLKSVTESVKPN